MSQSFVGRSNTAILGIAIFLLVIGCVGRSIVTFTIVGRYIGRILLRRVSKLE